MLAMGAVSGVCGCQLENISLADLEDLVASPGGAVAGAALQTYIEKWAAKPGPDKASPRQSIIAPPDGITQPKQQWEGRLWKEAGRWGAKVKR